MPQLYHDSEPERLSTEDSLHKSLIPYFLPVAVSKLTPEKAREVFSDSVDGVFIDFIRIAIRKGSLK